MLRTRNRRFAILPWLILTCSLSGQTPPEIEQLQEGFRNPPSDCWPHTRWWWPGNPVSKEEITRELEQMKSVGIRGVEQITMPRVYDRVDIPYLSDRFIEMIRHTIGEARRLDMKVSLNFGGPGWIIGGPWVPEEDRAKDLIPTSLDLTGPSAFRGPLPDRLIRTRRSSEHYLPELSGDESLVAVVAGRVEKGRIDEASLVDLTDLATNRSIEWDVPEGDWKLMAFWLAVNRHSDAVDHFNKTAMERYCNYLGGRFKEAAGAEFGRTLESLFCDSFELPNLASGIYWSTGLMEKFRESRGYDLARYLPAIWWEVGNISPKIRYDVNSFLHDVGMEAFFDTFLNWCERNGIQGRIQPYGFTTDNIEAAGRTHIPEMEITPGEKDSAPWFDTRIGPKKYVSSGAHIYGRPIVSVEAYTFLHWERYRATLEELKIATDGFLRAGATRFVNHGFSFLPEQDLAPTRRMPWAPQVNPTNIWWKYYPLLAEYIARCCYLLRQGSFAPDIAVYSPLANQWTQDVLNSRRWTRDFDWGELGFLLVSNGYDFDLLNDEALQKLATFDGDKIRIRGMEYRVLLLPNIRAIPVATLAAVEKYVKGGGVVIALDRLPEAATGLADHEANDKKVRSIVERMFALPYGRDGVGRIDYGSGHAYFIRKVLDRKIWWDQRSSILDPFLDTIRNQLPPDFGIDFAGQGIRKNEGLTFLHRKLAGTDIYFVSNIQDRPVRLPVTFRIRDRSIREWNPLTGEMARRFQYRLTDQGTELPLRLAPYESTFFVFSGEGPGIHVVDTDLDEIRNLQGSTVEGLASGNGILRILLDEEGKVHDRSIQVLGLPAVFYISGPWDFRLEGRGFAGIERELIGLASWTDDPETRHVSGTGRYETRFDLPASYLADDLRIDLDLGKVGNIAEVFLNGSRAGTVWIRDQKIEVSGMLKPADNRLTLLVTNTNINRVSGLSEPPPVPLELVPRFGSGIGTKGAPEIGFQPLPASGLMGPVRLIPRKRVYLD